MFAAGSRQGPVRAKGCASKSICRSPSSKAAAVGIEEKAPRTTYTEEELHKFWSCKLVPLQVRLWHAILVGTGMRAGEFAEALIEDVHLDADDPFLHLRDTKNGRPHDVRLFGVALRAIDRWMSKAAPASENVPRGAGILTTSVK